MALYHPAFRLATRPRFTSSSSWSRSPSTRCISHLTRGQDYSFDGRRFDWDVSLNASPYASCELLSRISENPHIVETFRKVNLEHDRYFGNGAYMSPTTFREMFRHSPILQHLECPWDMYIRQMQEETKHAANGILGCYSQSAAAFLLTQLPEVRQLMLPRRWEANEPSYCVVKVLVALSYFGSRALSQLEWITVRCLTEDLEFMALPKLKCFVVEEGLITKQRRLKQLSLPSKLPMGEQLETLALNACEVDPGRIGFILDHTPKLTNLWYTHGFTATEEYAAYDPKDPAATPLSEDQWFEECEPWDLCGFIKAVENRRGKRLEELGITFYGTRMPLVPGSADFRGFEKLQHLDISLEYFINQLQNGDCVLADLLPQSLTLLNIHTWGEEEQHVDAVRRIFEGFEKMQAEKLPLLEGVRIVCPSDAPDAFLAECRRIKEQCAGLECAVELDLIEEDILN